MAQILQKYLDKTLYYFVDYNYRQQSLSPDMPANLVSELCCSATCLEECDCCPVALMSSDEVVAASNGLSLS